MEGFAALAVFAKQLSESQKNLPSTQHKQEQPRTNRDEVALPTTQNSAMEASQGRVLVAEKPTETEPRPSGCPVVTR
jgi:hypothetical protein